MWSVLVCVIVGTAAAREFSDDDHFKLPRLYHLDNYDRCLSQQGGLYCMGSFRLSVDRPNPLYNFLKEYSMDQSHFNRTLLHRGYCLSSRCPSSEQNATLRFERCVERHALFPGLRASLETYTCSTPQDLKVNDAMDTPERIFLAVVCVFLFLNAIGTLYDYVADGEGKNKLLMAWSVRSNWQRLIATHEDGDPRLSALGPIQGIRVLLLSLVMLTHACEIPHKIYLYNPEYFEQVLLYPATMLIRNGSSLVQVFFVISNFLFAYSLLLISKNRPIGLANLPLCILHRLARLTPVHLLAVGFAATWWRRAGGGPQWAASVGAESDTCRRKFWAHALFLHNFVESEDHCLLQTWFLAVDMQLFIIAAVVMMYLMEKKKNPIPTLTILFFLACFMNALLAYINEWKSLLYIMVPENVRSTFRGVPSFSQFYTAPWGSLPAGLLGLLTANIHFAMQEKGDKFSKHKWLVWLTKMSVPMYVSWILAGSAVAPHASRAAAAAYVAVERPGFALITAVTLLGIANNIDSPFRRLAAWRGWTALGRMSLSLLMLHWLINMRLVGTRRTLFEVSVFSIGSDFLSTWFWSHVAAVPLTLLVESPAQRFLMALVV